MATVVSIGRNVGETPMDDGDWAAFRGQVRGILRPTAGAIVFDSTGAGEWEGAGEESATFIAAGEATGDLADILRRSLRSLARIYGQEAIALTVGETEFLG